MNALNWEEYRKLAARTESIPPIALAHDNGKTPNHILIRLLHAQLGLCTEFTEFHDAKTRANAIEELGDMLWYLALIDNTISVASLQSLVEENKQFDQDISQYVSASHWIAEMADVLKRCIYYAEPFNEANKKGIIPSKRFEVAYWGVIRWMEDIISDQSFPSMGELMHMNIEKLSKRFSDLKFTQDAVLNRNVENELSHIQDTFETTQIEIEKVLEQTDEASDLDFNTFSKELVLRFPSLTDQLVFGSQFFAALDNYYSTNGCDAMSKAWKCGYTELMACRPNNAAKAHKDIWAVMDVWGQFHIYGKPLTVQQLHVMFDDQRKLCLCPSMLKK